MTVNISFLNLLFICDRKMIEYRNGFMCIFNWSFVDIGTFLFALLPIASAPAWFRFMCMLLSCVMMGGGLGLYVAVDRGFGALEGLVKYVCKKRKFTL